MALENRTIAVTGGMGFIGSWIAEALCGKNMVRVLDNFSSGNPANLAKVKKAVRIVRCDIRDAGKVSAGLKGTDMVFHQAANIMIPVSVKDPVFDANVNILGTMNVLEACRKNDVKRLVFASSSAVYGEVEYLPINEDNIPNPKSPYACSKMAAEFYTRLYWQLYGLETVCLRYFNVYGPRQNPDSPYSGVISIFSKRLAENKPIIVYGDGNQTRDFVNVKDVVAANLLAAESDEAIGRAINIGSGKSVSINKLAETMQKAAGRKATVGHEEARPGDIRHSVADIGLAKKTLGFKPQIALEDGLKELVPGNK